MKAMIMLLLVSVAPAALAEEDIYRSTLPDGRVVYGESPYPGAKSVRKIPPPPVSTGMTYVTPGEKERGAPRALPSESRGGVVVIPQQERPPTQPAVTGPAVGPSVLPKRAY